MIDFLGQLARPLLFALDPEQAHGLSIAALSKLPPVSLGIDDAILAVTAMGLRFPNPLGMAAGYDKGGEVPDALLRLGFGFVEAGTITPLQQPGNPKPRLFRLVEDEGVINRLGFNSEGHGPPHGRLAARRGRPGILGVNVGANKEATDRTADYVRGVEVFADVATYFTINISSPNTPGLRDLQQAAALDDLLARVLAARDASIAAHGYKPVVLKIAPDLDLGDLDDIVGVARARRIDALLIGNTTISRPAHLRSRNAAEAGGLSGRPLFPLATQMLAQAWLRVEGQFPLIGAGGIDSAATALSKIEAGATLLQLYSSLVFKGPGLPRSILRGLVSHLKQNGLPDLAPLVGSRAVDWARAR